MRRQLELPELTVPVLLSVHTRFRGPLRYYEF